MKRFLLFSILFVSIATQVISQSKVVPVSKSELTGIELPAGTKQDKRILATAAAETLLEMTAEENATKLEGQAEVFTMPPSLQEQVRAAAQKAGWEIQPYTTDAAYSLLKNNGRILLMYLESNKKETSLYIMPVASIPQEAVVVTQAAPPTQADPQTQSQPAVQSQAAAVPVVVTTAQQANTTPTSAFTFTTTNFDDGWVSTIANDFVQVTKGNITVLLYYGLEITDELRSSNVEFSDYYWNQLVVPNYRVKSAYRYQEGVTYFRTYFIEGEAVNPQTGKSCYLALNVLVNSGVSTPVLAIAPDKNSYYQQFPEPKALGNMTGYNKFAVAAKDIVGTWEESSGSAVNLYNTYTGNYAGMNSTQGYDKFMFNADGTYNSQHSGASSVYGVNTVFSQEYNGKVTVTNWDMSMTKRWKDATENFNAQFEAVRGGRILHLQNKESTGIWYHLARTKQ
jgi:hypothetical protein